MTSEIGCYACLERSSKFVFTLLWVSGDPCLLPDADRDDLQHLALPGGGGWCHRGILPLWVEKERHRGKLGPLPLT